MAVKLPRWQLVLTWLLVALAVLATELATIKPGFAYDTNRWLDWLITLLLTAPLAIMVARHQAGKSATRVPPVLFILTLSLFLLPVLMALTGRLLGYQGLLLEIILAASLRNLAIALACLVHWPRLIYSAAMVSLFLMVFALVQGEGKLILACLALYSALGCCWLLNWYWLHLVKQEHRCAAPWGAIGLLMLILSGILVMTLVGPAKAAQTLWGFLPSSGGRDDYDPFSRGGVNTGDEVIKGSQESTSTGMTDSDFFLDSPDDALYDVAHDLYGDVIKPRDWQRTIALPAEKMLKKEIIPAESLNASKEFSLLRQPPPPTGEMGNQGPSALLYVQGRVPVHLRLKAYELFDGIIWSEPEYHGSTGDVHRDEAPWMKISYYQWPELFSQPEKHVIKIARFKTDALPFPPQIQRFRVGKIHDRTFFGWSQDGILRMVERNVPKGTLTEVETAVVDVRLLESKRLAWDKPTRLLNYVSLPGIDSLVEKLNALALRYAGETPRGWKQIEAIVAGVRQDFQLNRKAQPPADCRDVLSHFLECRTGRDVDFATLTAMLLRTQGYPCRVVSGFYGDPAHHDANTDHTLIFKDDMHFWVEVLAGGKVWVPVEPTPGYQLASPLYSWIDRLQQAAAAFWQWCLQHPLAMALLLGLVLAAIINRQELLDRWYRLRWRWLTGQSPREQLRFTQALLDRRSRGTAWQRPCGITPSLWYPQQCPELDRWAAMFAWAGYAPPYVECPWTVHEVTATCDTIVQSYPRRQVRRLSSSQTSTLSP
ncbi:MAG: hypothetical protein JNJ77_04580 [Planctomycetia bacterium]|nr:hypothetical protein [Planctomycetia bacterium]